MSKKANVIEAKGRSSKNGNGYFNVELEDPKDHECLCRASGRLITRKFNCLLAIESLLNCRHTTLTEGVSPCVRNERRFYKLNKRAYIICLD